MGQNQQKGASGIGTVSATIKSLESGTINTTSQSSSPILHGTNSANSHMPDTCHFEGQGVNGKGGVVRQKD